MRFSLASFLGGVVLSAFLGVGLEYQAGMRVGVAEEEVRSLKEDLARELARLAEAKPLPLLPLLPLLPGFSGESASVFETPKSIVPKFVLPPIVIPGEENQASNLPFLPENFGSDESVDGFLWGLKEERRMNSLWFPKRNPWSDI